MSKRLYRSRKDKYLAGVCGGVADYFNIDPTIVRILVVIIAISSVGTAAVAYLIMAIVVPEVPDGYVPEDNGERQTLDSSNTRQVLGTILVGAGALILLSRMVSWFDSGMILAIGIIAVGAFILFRRTE